MLKKASYIGYTAFLATGPALLTACSNSTAADQPQDPSVLFSLSSDAMHFENPDGMNVTLVMDGVDPDTIWFTDRPTRDSGAITTTKLAAEWVKGGTFAADPPNAALVLHEPTKVDSTTADTLVAEVQDASYDAANKTFRADLKVLQPQEAATIGGNLAAHGDRHDAAWPSHAGAVSLFIDSVNLEAVQAEATPNPATSGTDTPASVSSSSAPAPASTSASAASSPLAVGAKPQVAKAQGTIKLCSTPSTCNNSTTGNITYNSTIYFQINVSQSSPTSMERPGAISAPVRVD